MCLCTQKLLHEIPCTAPKTQDAEVMKKNTYFRAFIIDWVQRNANPNVYDTSLGYYIKNGEFLTIPLCEKHYGSFRVS
jgi:hypothetical protein